MILILIIGKIEENWMENKLNYKRKIGAQRRFLKIKIFLFFDLKKQLFYCLFLLVSSICSIKIMILILIMVQKDRKLKEEQIEL
jgi:hypothetical protein